ncbi:hypothetical protein K435DRAFT_794493 [Dendrothele bispora CBS 962.96]|uniref:Uncharacterized protein n=1 Tax=Dendrothele bispora (strain CBS 962.96) TaxID=1314807 RepID=A0A4S8MCI0_DENBC|nr:hypothetical protein K435DRAFT_794493 [Dendrothele bispora CBS 962.96]
MPSYTLAIVETTADHSLRNLHQGFSRILDFEIKFESAKPESFETVLQSLREGRINAILVSRIIDCAINPDHLELDESAKASGLVDFVVIVSGVPCGFDTQIQSLHFAITSGVAYPEFRSTLLVGTGPSIKAAVYVLSRHFDCSWFYVVWYFLFCLFEPRVEVYNDFVEFCERVNSDIRMSRVTQNWMVPTGTPVQCVVTDTTLDEQEDMSDDRRRLLKRVFAALHANMYSRHRGLFLNIGPLLVPSPTLTSWTKFAQNYMWHSVLLETLCTTNMPSFPNLACAIVDLSRRRVPTICTVPFARTYAHAGTIDDLLLDHWFPPAPHSYFREGLSARRLRLGHRFDDPDVSLIHPYTIIVSAAPPKGYIDFTAGVAVVVKHAGPSHEEFRLVDVTSVDLAVISDNIRFLSRNQVNNGYRCSDLFNDYQYLAVDRRHLVGVTSPIPSIQRITVVRTVDCRCFFCQLSVEVVLIAMEYFDIGALAAFSGTCRTHSSFARQTMQQRVRRVLNQLKDADLDDNRIHDILRVTGSVITGAAGVTPMLSGLPALPTKFDILTPLNSIRPWLQLFQQVPTLGSYVYSNKKPKMDGFRLERMRCVFFLRSGVVVSIRESYSQSILPLLLSQSITAHVGSVNLYSTMTNIRLGTSRGTAQEYPSILSLFRAGWVLLLDATCPGVGLQVVTNWRPFRGTSPLMTMSLSFPSLGTTCGERGQLVLICGVLREMWMFDDAHSQNKDNSSWYILEIAPSTDNDALFRDVYTSLTNMGPMDDTFLHAVGEQDIVDAHVQYLLVCLPSPLALITAACNVTIDPAPFPNHPCLPFYNHWDNERKTLTPNATVVVNFHIVVDRSRGKRMAILVADSVSVLECGVPWYSLCEDKSEMRLVQNNAQMSS